MGAQRAAWAVTFDSETASLTNVDHAASLLDLVKAFESVPHCAIAAAAAKHHYCLAVLRLSLAAYRISRSIGVDGVFSRCIVATCGVTAGSGFATTELKLLLRDLVLALSARWPVLRLALYVDDLTLAAAGRFGRAQALVAKATDFAVGLFERMLNLNVSPTKLAAVASRYGIAKDVLVLMKTKKLLACRATKLLGVPFAGGWSRSVKTLKV